jgi:hypothetical protein
MGATWLPHSQRHDLETTITRECCTPRYGRHVVTTAHHATVKLRLHENFLRTCAATLPAACRFADCWLRFFSCGSAGPWFSISSQRVCRRRAVQPRIGQAASRRFCLAACICVFTSVAAFCRFLYGHPGYQPQQPRRRVDCYSGKANMHNFLSVPEIPHQTSLHIVHVLLYPQLWGHATSPACAVQVTSLESAVKRLQLQLAAHEVKVQP